MSLSNKLRTRNEKANPVTSMVAALFLMYIISGLLLLFLALLLYQMQLSESVVKIVVIMIYVLSGASGGFFIGKRMKDQKFMWGLLAGAMYFVLLFLISLIVKQGASPDSAIIEPVKLVTTLILCSASGMAGGMVS